MKRKEHKKALFFQKAFKPSFYGIPDKFLQLLPGQESSCHLLQLSFRKGQYSGKLPQHHGEHV